jgi:uncharacterized membrane protein
MNTINTSACVQVGYDTFKRNPVPHILASLLVGLLSSVGMGILTGPLLVGYMHMLRNESMGQPAQAGDVLKGFNDFVPGLIVGLLGQLIVVTGYGLCVVPGLLLSPLMAYAVYFVAAGEKDGIAAIRHAFDVVQANLIPGAVCSFLIGCVACLGVLGCGVGIVFTIPIAAIASFEMCRQAIGAEVAISSGA